MKKFLITLFYILKPDNMKPFHEGKEKCPIYVSKKCCEKKDYDRTLHHGRKYFCRYFLQVFKTESLKCHNNCCFKINGKHRINIST